MSTEVISRTVRLPSGEHQHAVDMLCELFKSSSRWEQRDNDFWPITGIGIEFHTPSPVVEVPDVVVLNVRPIGNVFRTDQVVLVAEVWSPEESAEDRRRKFDLYGRAGIRYFWTVDLGGPVIETYEHVGGNSYERRDVMRDSKVHEITTAPIPVMIKAALLVPE
jgi:Uma2 family endonuclease